MVKLCCQPFLKVYLEYYLIQPTSFHLVRRTASKINPAMVLSMRTKFKLAWDMFQALCQMLEFLRPAISKVSVIIWWAILISEIFPTLFECREESSLIKCHVFLGFDLLSSRLSIKYLRLAFLINFAIFLIPGSSLLSPCWLFTVQHGFIFFQKSLLCIWRHTLSVIQKAFLLTTGLDLSGHVCLWIALAYPSTWTTYHLDRLVFQCQTTPFVAGSLGSQTYRRFSCDFFFFFILAPEHSYLALCVI